MSIFPVVGEDTIRIRVVCIGTSSTNTFTLTNATITKVQELLKSGVNILGGCCGTNPSHIKKMREVLDLFLNYSI